MASSSKDTFTTQAPVIEEIVKKDDKTYTVSQRDIELMLSVINLVTSRRGFNPAEFKEVGELFEKLSSLKKEK